MTTTNMAETIQKYKLTVADILTTVLTDSQVEDLWHDWFCKDEALVRHGRALIKRLQSIGSSRRIPRNANIFFKNNCPLHGRLYNSFSITDPVSGAVLFWVTPKLGYDASNGEAQVSYGNHNAENTVTGSWSDIKKFFSSTDEEWAAHLATLPKPKFMVGVKVAVLGDYKGVTEDEVILVLDEGRFILKARGEFCVFKPNGEQVVHNYGRRGHQPRVLRCEVWSEYHDKEVAKQNAKAERDDLAKRINAIRNKLYGFDCGTNEAVIARKSVIMALEAILEIK